MSVTDIQTIFNSLSLKDLLKCRKILDTTIEKSLHVDKKYVAELNPEPLIKYNEDFIELNSELYRGVRSDIKTLGIDNCNQDEAKKIIQNRWLTSTGKPYTWTSTKSKKSFSHKPVLITDYPAIEELRVIINDKFGSNLNSCLATYYPPGTGINLHADDEKELDDLQPISVATFGDCQSVEFVKKYRGSNSRADLNLVPADGSVYHMLPNCQNVLRHRVKASTDKVDSWRVSLSFRRMLSDDEVDKNSTSIRLDQNFVFSSVNDGVKDTLKKCKDVEEKKGDSSETDLNIQDKLTKLINAPQDTSDKITKLMNAPEDTSDKKSTTVIFGTSITKWIEEKRLCRKGKRCINVSKSGAKISDIHRMVDDFVYSHEAAGDVANVIFNIGTNDIRYAKYGVDKYRESVLNLLSKTKLLFPLAKIMVFSTLPVRLLYRYTVKKFLRFNEILQECALAYNCIYVDCFWHFLNADRIDINENLYSWDGLHLKREGIQLLGRWMYSMIYAKVFSNIVTQIPIC